MENKTEQDIRIAVKLDIIYAQLLDCLGRRRPECIRDNIVICAMGEKNWSLLVRIVFRNVVLDLVAEKQVAGQTEYTAELLLVCDPREQGHCTTLGKATDDDTGRFDALLHLLFNQGVEVVAGTENSGLVLGTQSLFEIQLWV